ncbi:Hypothetical protein PAS_chr2-1_0035 [Komagataella phaffii GS115]|uniref:Uncharacterized protein n=1 Tax=Komagataella phaffii (strain GS115 / ATCC 20864) TaxID=644223 RepID=C4QZG1_KOMPG|nr:Hypothetical protein PAS_chr2-1_0035 [Komagataella phaffii GS115]CAY68635.1 Hypothetical protein PAS_chr2-1_0035 [Komagataella phaffii GS115]
MVERSGLYFFSSRLSSIQEVELIPAGGCIVEIKTSLQICSINFPTDYHSHLILEIIDDTLDRI